MMVVISCIAESSSIYSQRDEVRQEWNISISLMNKSRPIHLGEKLVRHMCCLTNRCLVAYMLFYFLKWLGLGLNHFFGCLDGICRARLWEISKLMFSFFHTIDIIYVLYLRELSRALAIACLAIQRGEGNEEKLLYTV